MTILTEEYVFACLELERDGVQFPIDFDDVWENVGYSRKSNALRAFLSLGFQLFKDMLRNEGINKNQGDKYYLTSDAFKHFCLAAKTEKGRQARQYFIDIEKEYRSQLERSLFATPDPELERLRQRVAELEAKLEASETHAAFPYTLEELHEISGIVNKSHVKGAVLLSFEPDIDYMERNGKLFLSTDTFSILITSLRSKRGTDISRLPAIIRLQTIKYFQYVQPKRKNTRLGQRECPGQLTLL